MKEVKGDLWSYDGRKGFILLITTNGFIKKDGTGVMGAGVAKQAAERYPDLPRLLGQALRDRGNIVTPLTFNIMAFPVKHEWMNDADLKLIRRSTKQLKKLADSHTNSKFILPRPGCGNGHRDWETEIKPIVEILPDNVFVIDE